MNLLVLGPQGSGKGTQAKRLSSDYDIPHVSTGDMFRAAMANGTEVGLRVKAVYDAGGLVSDELTNALVEERLSESDVASGFILDGFPRNLGQADALDGILDRTSRVIDAVFFFDLSDEIALERMRARAHEGRADDTPEAMARRLEIYHQQTASVVEHYRATGKLVPLHADRPIDSVYAEIEAALLHLESRS